MTAPLREKQQRFLEEYLKDSNGKQAAIRAGYSPKTAEVQASQLLSKTKVKAALEDLRAPVRESAGLTLESHLNELSALREEARKAEQFSAAISAEVNRGRAAGLYVERSEVKVEEVETLAVRRRSGLKIA